MQFEIGDNFPKIRVENYTNIIIAASDYHIYFFKLHSNIYLIQNRRKFNVTL